MARGSGLAGPGVVGWGIPLQGRCGITVHRLVIPGDENARSQRQIPWVDVLLISVLVTTGNYRDLLYLEGVGEVNILLWYVVLGAVLVYWRPGLHFY